MDNLKYPKKSYFVEDLGIDNFAKSGSKLIFKNEGVIVDTSEFSVKHLTNDGASGARFLEFRNDAQCYMQCSYTGGFAIKQVYQTPGKGNKFPYNHINGGGYFEKVSPVNITDGVIQPASLRKLEEGVLSQIKSYHAGSEKDKFFTAFKGVIIDDKTGTGVITLNGVASAVITLNAASIKSLTGMMAIEIDNGKVLIFALNNGDYFDISSISGATILKEGIIVLGDSPEVNIHIHSAETMNVEYLELFAVKTPAVTGLSYSLRFLGDGLNVDKTFASAASFSLTNVYHTVSNNVLYITSGAKTLNEIVILPGTSITMYPEFVFNASGNGSWPTMATKTLRERFIGAYVGQFGKIQVVPSAKRHVELLFVKTGTTPENSGGASNYVNYKTRISFVIPYDVYKTSSDLLSL